MVAGEVAWFKAHRRILESDIVPIRRADGRAVDGWVHVGPSGEDAALAMFFNPLDVAVDADVEIPLAYAGLRGEVRVRVDDGAWTEARTDARSTALDEARDSRACVDGGFGASILRRHGDRGSSMKIV
jgi:hypothetical protein